MPAGAFPPAGKTFRAWEKTFPGLKMPFPRCKKTFRVWNISFSSGWAGVEGESGWHRTRAKQIDQNEDPIVEDVGTGADP